ncbi:hypothetical protein [Azospirillum sp.]|uniref:hypothetical protein n=1 Tax=Azospirillum sp. TaxID=34012 RepID=UPI003D7069BA
MEWFRSYHGAPMDPKWLTVARKANTTPAAVAAVWWAILDFASQNEDRGSFSGFDCETADGFFGLTDGTSAAIIAALRDRQCIIEDRVSKWEKRQPKREDSGATERKRAQRERDREKVDASSRDVTHGHAASRDVTTDKNREDTEQNPPKSPRAGGTDRGEVDRQFDAFWDVYPKRGHAANPRKPAAEKFARLVKGGVDPADIIAGAKAYASSMRQTGKDGTEYVMQATRWLNQEVWRDYANVHHIAQAEPWRTDPKAWKDNDRPPPWPDAPTGTECGRWRKCGGSWAFMR